MIITSSSSFSLVTVCQNRNVILSICVSLWVALRIETNDVRVIQDEIYKILSKLTTLSFVTLIKLSIDFGEHVVI